MFKAHPPRTRSAVLACGLLASAATGQATVLVGAGENLSQAALESGSFMGQIFALDPLTTFEINSGGSIGNVGGPFSFGGATVNINDGGTFVSVPNRNRSFFADVSLNLAAGGSLGDRAVANAGSFVNITGGTIGTDFNATTGAVVEMSAGSIGANGDLINGAELNMTGGSLGDNFGIFSNDEFGFSVANISGGSVGEALVLSNESTLNLFVTAATVDGVALPLVLGTPLTVTQRASALLEATLADGSPIDLLLNEFGGSGVDNINGVLTVTLVPSPGTVALLGLAVPCLTARRRR